MKKKHEIKNEMNDKEREGGASLLGFTAIITWCAAIICAFFDPMQSLAFVGCTFLILYVLKHA